MQLSEVERARAELPAQVRRTPVVRGPRPGLVLKCENLQFTGAYKVRAAFTVLKRMPAGRGAALASSGNFARAFATAGRLLGIPTTLVMMEKTEPFKVERTRAAGGLVVLCENRYEARFETLRRLERDEGLVAVDHTEDPTVVAGHGTIGLELCEQVPDLETVVVPVSTGGLLAGVALAVKSRLPKVRVVGVQPSGSRAAVESFRRGQPVTLAVDTVCDALTASRPGALPFELIQRFVDDIVEVPEEAVYPAVKELAVESKLVVEPGAAVGLAAVACGLVQGPCCLLLSGGNIDPARLGRILS